jgi:putative ABC transport system permease protein
MLRWLSGLRVAFRTALRRSRVEAELREEFQYHFDRQTAEGLKAGLDPAQARDAAMRAMGAIEKNKEECRDLRSAHIVSDAVGDVKYALRALRRSPGFAVLAIAIMSLGIGANTAVFSIVNAVLLKPLPYDGADRLVTISTSITRTSERNPLVALANFRDWRDRASTFEAMATFRGGDAPVTPGTADGAGAGQAEYGRHANVDPDFFRVLGVQPALGRTWTPEELMPDNKEPAVLISHSYWQSRFGSDPGVLDRTLRLGVTPWRIVGVLPPGFQFPSRADIWSPQTGRGPGSRTSHSFLAIGRLKAGVSIEQAQADLATIAGGLEQAFPESNKGRGVVLDPLHDRLVGDVRQTLYLVWGVVALVLLIACANTATLLMGKATARTREVAVRAALGADRRRIARQLITESVLLALIAGIAGTLLANWGAAVLVALSPSDVVRFADTRIDRAVLVFTLGITLLTSLLFGLVPALHASHVDLIDALKNDGARAIASVRAFRTRGALVVCEIALAVVLLTGAGLLMKSLVALHQVELGYRPANALVMKATGVRPLAETNAYFRDVMSRIAALPGVVAVGATMVPPGDLSNSGNGAYFIDRIPEVRDRSRDPFAYFNVIAPGTFAASGIPVKSGRDFNDGDVAGRPMVAIVNEALVRRSFDGANPIGRSIYCSFDSKDAMTIVGVVGDVRQRNPAIEPLPDCYMPYTQHTYNNRTMHVIIRTAGEPSALAEVIRQLAAGVSAEVPVSFETMEATVAKGIEAPRFRGLLFSVFAALAVGLAMAGVYGLVACSVQQRSREVGVRMALGASRDMVLGMILRQGLVLAGIGLTIGLAAAAAATRMLQTMLFDVQPLDPQVYASVAILLGLVTLAAGYVPARRAAAMNPIEVLKTD